jgi:hypothetical protein
VASRLSENDAKNGFSAGKYIFSSARNIFSPAEQSFSTAGKLSQIDENIPQADGEAVAS